MNLEGKEVAWGQLGASIDMLERAMTACPDDLWNRPAKEMVFRHMADHTLWFLEFDFSPAVQEFKSPPFDVHEYELRNLPPPYEHPYPGAIFRTICNGVEVHPPKPILSINDYIEFR